MMDSVLDLSLSRKARTERCERFKTAANDLLLLLDQHRQHISPEFMTFLMAMVASDQALHYASQAGSKQKGLEFLDDLQLSAQQIFETQYQTGPARVRESRMPSSGQLIDLFGSPASLPEE